MRLLLQVVGAVGWGNAQLPLPDDILPPLKSLIASCWLQPQDRPGFGDIIAILKPMVQNTPTPPPPPMLNSELVNMQQVRPMQSPMLAGANSGLSQQRHRQQQQQHSQQHHPQQQQQHTQHNQQQQQQNLHMGGGSYSLTGQGSSHALQGQQMLAPRHSHDPADAAGDKFAEVVRRVMHMASNAKNTVEQHVGEQPPGLHSSPSRMDSQTG